MSNNIVDNCDLIKSGVSIAERRAIKCGFNAPKLSNPRFSFNANNTMSSDKTPNTMSESPILLPNSQLSPTTGSFTPYLHDGNTKRDENTQMVVSTSFVDVEDGNDYNCSINPHTTALPYQDTKVFSNGDIGQNLVANNECQYLHPIKDYPDASAGSGPRPISTGEDGYNWRKYGQKVVKGSGFPHRSYYRCTHQTCQMKKVVECSSDGRITEIIYKGGVHDHLMPQTCRRSSFLPFNEASKIIADDCEDSCMEASSNPSLALGIRRSKFDCREPELSDLHATTRGTLEFSSTPVTRHEDDNKEADIATQGNFFIGHDTGENAPHNKKSNKENCFVETNFGSKAIREPKVVIKIETEVDILDDGYRWRKYGQKVVKGNPNPRNYYKCTDPRCPIKKHVERSAECKKFVLVTYEGKHNHVIPDPKNNGHSNSGNTKLHANSTQTTLATPTNYYQIPKREPYTHTFPLKFNPKFECDDELLGPNFVGNLSMGISWFYPPLKLPAFPNNTPYSSCSPNGLNVDRSDCILPPFSNTSFPIPPKFSNPMSGHCNPEMSCSPAQFVYAEQQIKESNDKLLTPKWEQRDNLFFETDSRSIDHIDASSSSVYNQSMRTNKS